MIYSEIGHQLGVPTPIMDSVITLTKALLGRDFEAERRTVARCGIAWMTAEALLEYVATGRR